MRKRQKIVGRSYLYRMDDILRIYEEHARSGLSNREILRQFIWPKYHICEKTFYNMVNNSAEPRYQTALTQIGAQLELFS